jgi:hypothetical protein
MRQWFCMGLVAAVAGSSSCALAAGQGIWSAVPIVSAAIRQAGFTGGEGCQVLRDLQISRSDPSFLIMVLDPHARCGVAVVVVVVVR